jgi:hypothetical protein
MEFLSLDRQDSLQAVAEGPRPRKTHVKDESEERVQGRHSPNVSTILLRFFYDFSTIIPCAHILSFPRKSLVSRSKENPSPNLACTKFFYNFSTKSP